MHFANAKCCEFFFAAMKDGRDFLWKPKNSLETETKCCEFALPAL